MKLSAEQAKLFFRRAQRRFKVSNDFIHRNMSAMLKFVQYAITPRIVLKRKLIRKRNRVFLHHNYLRKLIFDPTKLRKKRHAKRLHSQWSKRLVLHLKRFDVVEFVEEEETTTATAVFPEKEVSEQLKEQLELLKSGKRTVPLLEDAANVLKQSEQDSNSEGRCSNDVVQEPENLETITINDETDSEEPEIKMEVPLLTAVHISEEEFKSSSDVPYSKKIEKPNGNFLDMLISKVKQTADESCVTETLPAVVVENAMEPPKQYNKSFEKEAPATVNLTEERENSNSSSDFFGFEDSERVLGNFPGMLSTPLVRKRDSNSAFVSETLNAYMRDNSLESSAAVNYPQRRPEDGQVLAKSIPPKLDMPALPEGLQGLRTVAERRAFLQRTKSTKYCIINNIATIFRELQKKSKGHRIFKQAIESVMNSSSVPMTRQGWKAATWLLTDLGNYYSQTIIVDGENFRLHGGRGNYRNKFKRPHSSRSNRVFTLCPEDCFDRITFRTLRPVRTPEKRSKLNDSTNKVVYKPCPLSHKILQQPHDEESVFGSLDIVRMPQVELEVFPKLQKPLSEIAKKYLQLILPYHGITREWAEFSVSTLLERQKMELATNKHESFTFKIPYANDRNHLIIRRVYQRSEEFEGNNSSLSFRKEIDEKNSDGEPSDLVAVECADMLTDMLNSVAIGCSENSFIKDDPDNIYQYDGDEEMIVEKLVRKIEPNQQQVGMSHKKQSRLLNELRRLNATVIDAAIPKSEEDATICEKECCKLGCVCSSLNEGPTIRKHCGKQRCVLECKCKCPSVLRLETDSGKITTEDAFMLRRQATAKLARVEKEFTSTIVLTGSETLLINESQYDKKRRCTKIPKRYGDFVEHDEPDSVDVKPFSKRTEASSALNFPLDPILVNEKTYRRLKHSSVKLKKLHDVQDLAPWCMIHMVYKCFCKGKAIVGNPIVIEKQEELPEVTITDEPSSVAKNRTLYSFEKEESKANEGTNSGYTSDPYESSETSDASEGNSDPNFGPVPVVEEPNKIEKRGRISDNHCIDVYMNAKANHCRRVVPIPKNIYQRRNKKRVAHIQLYIAENENDKTRLSLNEHVLRSVYYHLDSNGKRKFLPVIKKEEKPKLEIMIPPSRDRSRKSNPPNANKPENKSFNEKVDDKSPVPLKKRRMSMANLEGSSFLRFNPYNDTLKNETPKDGATNSPQKYIQASAEITIPKISQIFSLNSGIIEMGSESSSSAQLPDTEPEKQPQPNPKPGPEPGSVLVPVPVPVSMPVPEPEFEHQPTSAIEIAQPPSEEMASAHGVSTDAFKNVFKQVIKNMNNLVSKKMQDIDMALRRESKAIPAPNAEILCIIRWNNFLEAYLEGFVYLWEVRTINLTFIAATIKPIMPLVMNALSVVNIQALSRENLPLLGKMLIDRKRSATSEGLAVVMQGQKMYWIVKGFLRPDKTRICPKPTPDSHPLLTRKINVLCRLLINNQFNEHKKRQDALQIPSSSNSPQLPVKSTKDVTEKQQTGEIPTAQKGPNPTFEPSTTPEASSPLNPPVLIAQNSISLKLKVLPMQRNISDQATTILEQMVAQAYGFVRTNISFRKIRKNELFEIFPPAKLNSNHHWLVLDISNDFSHIFVPELKDLLTLDRIQKVMAYALAKNRIVKMQFSQKSLFNAYVTPKSQRKLYFGPYRQSITTPKLVLLQSVDGQMMLREVYESRHNIIPKTFSTTAFWVVQKSGKIFLDIELDQVSPTEVHEQDMEEDNDILVLNDCETRQNGIAQQIPEVQQNAHIQPYQGNQLRESDQAQLNGPVQQNAHFQQDNQIQQSAQALQPREVQQQNLQDHVEQGFQIQDSGQQVVQRSQNIQFQSGQIVQLPQCNNVQQDCPDEQRTEDHNSGAMLSSHKGQESIVLDENLLEMQNIPVIENSSSANFNNTIYIDEDDDCMIVDDEPNTNTVSPVVAPVFPPASVSMSTLPTLPTLPTVSTAAPLHQTNQDRINYTISYGGENSSLVVIQNQCEHVPTSIQNQCERVPTSMADMVGNNFTILSSIPQSPAVELPEMTQSQNNSLQQKSQQPLPINTVFNFASEDCRPIDLQPCNDNFKPGEIILTFPTNDANTNVSIPAEHISNFSITPILTNNTNEPNRTESPISKMSQMVVPSESENNQTSVFDSKTIASFGDIQWNKNITIKKIMTDAEGNPTAPLTYSRKSFPATAQKPITGTTNSTSRLSMQPQKQQSQIMQPKVPQVGQVIRQIQQKKITPQQIIRIPNQQMNSQIRLPVQKPNTNSNQNIIQRTQSGLVVRSPSLLNTVVRGQQPNIFRSAGGSTSLIKPTAPNSLLSVRQIRPPSTTSQIVRLQSVAKPIIAKTINTKNIALKTGVSKASPNLMVKKILPNSVQSLQKDIVKRMITSNQQTSLLQKEFKMAVNNSKAVTSPLECSKNSQGDPVLIPEGSVKTVSINLPQPKLPNGIKTVQEISQSHAVSPVSNVISAGGIKRNSLGTPVSRLTQFRVQQGLKTMQKVNSTVARADSNVVKQNSPVKGIPIELPRLKKFAIISSAAQNTKSITPPPSSKTSGKNESEMSTPVSSLSSTSYSSANPVLRKLIEPIPIELIQNSSSNKTASSTLTSTTAITTTTTTTTTTTAASAAATKPTVSISSVTSKISPPGSSNANAEYGYFHANMDGLPKFVVKRVGDDFLIKVPNFNGILKLTGLSTVHNYLNQYTTQKCGKTNEEIANLKWTFRTQDRSKLNNINKANPSNIKSGNNTPNMQKLFSLKKNSNEQTASSSTSLAPATNKVNLQSAPSNPLEPNDSIDLSDDE